MNRFGISPKEFDALTPGEFGAALEDFEKTHFVAMKRICETLRLVALMIVNHAGFGRKKHQMVQDPQTLFQFSWERTYVQTVDEMKAFVKGLAEARGLQLTTKSGKADEDAGRTVNTVLE